MEKKILNSQMTKSNPMNNPGIGNAAPKIPNIRPNSMMNKEKTALPNQSLVGNIGKKEMATNNNTNTFEIDQTFMNYSSNIDIDNTINNYSNMKERETMPYYISDTSNNNKNMSNCMNRREMAMKIRELDFAIIDLALYLDTHPEDEKALCMHRDYCKKVKDLKEKYQKVFGPLTISFPCNKWRWLEEPWPWERGNY